MSLTNEISFNQLSEFEIARIVNIFDVLDKNNKECIKIIEEYKQKSKRVFEKERCNDVLASIKYKRNKAENILEECKCDYVSKSKEINNLIEWGYFKDPNQIKKEEIRLLNLNNRERQYRAVCTVINNYLFKVEDLFLTLSSIQLEASLSLLLSMNRINWERHMDNPFRLSNEELNKALQKFSEELDKYFQESNEAFNENYQLRNKKLQELEKYFREFDKHIKQLNEANLNEVNQNEGKEIKDLYEIFDIDTINIALDSDKQKLFKKFKEYLNYKKERDLGQVLSLDKTNQISYYDKQKLFEKFNENLYNVKKCSQADNIKKLTTT